MTLDTPHTSDPARTPSPSRPSLLLDSPVSHAGYWFATAVGATWGFLMSTGQVERRNGLLVFTGMPKRAFGRGGSCVGGCYLTDTNVSDDVLEHEAVHKQQWRRYGMLFPLLYFVAGRDPLRNRFEIEAGLEKGGYVRKRRRNTRRTTPPRDSQTGDAPKV